MLSFKFGARESPFVVAFPPSPAERAARKGGLFDCKPLAFAGCGSDECGGRETTMTKRITTNRAEMTWRACPTDTIDQVNILALEPDGRVFGNVAHVITPDGEGTHTLVPLLVAAPAMLAALQATKALWDQHGLGDDHDGSEGTYRDVCQAIANATGRPCGAMFGGTVQPENMAYTFPARRKR